MNTEEVLKQNSRDSLIWNNLLDSRRELYNKPSSNVKYQKISFKKYLQSNLLHPTSFIHLNNRKIIKTLKYAARYPVRPTNW